MTHSNGDFAAAWRLVRTPPGCAAWNMAVDHALAESAARGASGPVLRLYAWSPAAVSIGHNQPIRERRESLEELRARGMEAVRRPTGGRAVLHADEVTYSVAAPAGLPGLEGGLRGSCARIHAAILAGLARLGIADLSLHEGAPAAGPRRASACFATASRSEVAWRGRKLVGSAQRRLPGAILQQGSILLDSRLDAGQSALEALWPESFGGGRWTSLAEAGGRRFGFDEVAGAVRAGFTEALGAAFASSALQPHEEASATSLLHDLYGRDEFLYRM